MEILAWTEDKGSRLIPGDFLGLSNLDFRKKCEEVPFIGMSAPVSFVLGTVAKLPLTALCPKAAESLAVSSDL